MADFLRTRRRALDTWLAERGLTHTVSLPVYQLHREILRLLDRHARGPCLDAGSGRAPFRAALEERGIKVISVDVEDRSGRLDHIADVQDMAVIGDASVATVLCTQVWEHLPRPWAAAREVARVLQPSGTAILSVPHLSMIHEAPNDYYRFTGFGLEALLSEAGLEVDSMVAAGGLISFLAHGASVAFLCLVGGVRGLRRLAWLLNYVFLIRLLDPLDRWFGLRGLYPCNYVVLAHKAVAGDPPPEGA